ncbi:hypothetical protein [Herbiconiux sp.]|uniref:hypothetical protein n=1 Tax=Herbiconiux sp. TaxID=1871186 RepID=UPI0025BB031D|nr:hypothetical protein [Herbiconiux sp.]
MREITETTTQQLLGVEVNDECQVDVFVRGRLVLTLTAQDANDAGTMLLAAGIDAAVEAVVPDAERAARMASQAAMDWESAN